MLGAIGYNLRNLLNFRGRDARTTYWYFILLIFLGSMVLSVLAFAPSYVRMMGQVIQVSMENPDDPLAASRVMANGMSDMVDSMLLVSLVSGVLMILLLAASLVRRLHDSGLSGYWALIPGGFEVLSLVLLPGYMREMKQMMTAAYGPDPAAAMQSFNAMFSPVALLAYLPWIAIVVVGLRHSMPGPNRYGEAAVHFR